VYRNELDGATAERIATALAAMLWEDAPGEAPASGFPVVLGYDDRPWSLPLAVAVGGALRRCGCETIEIGLATGPAFRFAVAHLDAAGGVLATGAGGGPAVAGLDFALAGGRPLSLGGGLDRIADLVERPKGRMSRRGGARREFDVTVAYEAGLRRHFVAFAPTTAVVGCASPLLLGRLERLAVDLPGTLLRVPLPRRENGRDGADPASLARLSEAVRDAKAGFGLWIDEDGTACRALDETGRVVSVADFAGLLLADTLAERPGSAVALDWSLAEALCETQLRGEAVRGNGTAEAMAVSLRDHVPAAGADSAGRFWLPGPPAASDGLVTLARLLRVLTAANEPLSRRIAAANRA
jgi:phosphomannomutase